MQITKTQILIHLLDLLGIIVFVSMTYYIGLRLFYYMVYRMIKNLVHFP